MSSFMWGKNNLLPHIVLQASWGLEISRLWIWNISALEECLRGTDLEYKLALEKSSELDGWMHVNLLSTLQSSWRDLNSRKARSCCCQPDVPLRDAAPGCHTRTVNYLGKVERAGFRNVWQLKDLVWMPSSSWDNCVIALQSQRRKD